MSLTGGNIAQHASARVDALTRASCYCQWTAAIGEYHELNLTLQALAGHDTSELHEAIKETLASIVKLKAACVKAIERFKQQGFLFTIASVVKEEEQLVKEEEQLQ